MKNLFALVCLIVSLTLSAGQYMLPIGSNVNNRPARVQLAIGGYGVWAEDDFAYMPAMGELETVIRNRLWKLAEGFVPATGYDEAKAEVLVTPGPFGETVFKLQKLGNRWVVPNEALEMKLRYGGTVGFWLTGVTDVELGVRGGNRIDRFSTRDGIGSPCLLGAVIAGLGTEVALDTRYTVPSLKESWWTEGEVTLYAGEQFARFNILDGSLMETSQEQPVFLSQLVAPPVPPRITSIRRVADFTEISVAVADGTKLILEFSEDCKKWVRVDPPTVTKASAGSQAIAHRSSAPSGIYRVIAVEPAGPARKSTP